jgi:signal transduction histidine kinase
MPSQSLEFILKAIPDLLFRFDRAGNFLECYSTQSPLLSVPADQFKGKNLTHFFDPTIVASALDCIKKVIESKEEGGFEYSLIINGAPRYFESRVTSVDKDEVIAFIRDVTDRHLIQKKNDELIKINEELDSFIYRASHDLRAPLSSILGLTEIALRSGKREDMKSCLTMIRERVLAQDDVIHEIIDYARNLRTDVTYEKFDLKLLIFEVIDTLLFNEGADKIDFQVNVADDFEILSDRVRVNIILSNLLSNAVKYHDNSKENRFIKVNVRQDNSKLAIEVEDNGLGIPPDQHNKIFDMFYRASEKSTGSGLGLFIVKDILGKMNGTIEFTSIYKEGTRFTFFIPLGLQS